MSLSRHSPFAAAQTKHQEAVVRTSVFVGRKQGKKIQEDQIDPIAYSHEGEERSERRSTTSLGPSRVVQ